MKKCMLALAVLLAMLLASPAQASPLLIEVEDPFSKQRWVCQFNDGFDVVIVLQCTEADPDTTQRLRYFPQLEYVNGDFVVTRMEVEIVTGVWTETKASNEMEKLKRALEREDNPDEPGPGDILPKPEPDGQGGEVIPLHPEVAARKNGTAPYVKTRGSSYSIDGPAAGGTAINDKYMPVNILTTEVLDKSQSDGSVGAKTPLRLKVYVPQSSTAVRTIRASNGYYVGRGSVFTGKYRLHDGFGAFPAQTYSVSIPRGTGVSVVDLDLYYHDVYHASLGSTWYWKRVVVKVWDANIAGSTYVSFWYKARPITDPDEQDCINSEGYWTGADCA